MLQKMSDVFKAIPFPSLWVFPDIKRKNSLHFIKVFAKSQHSKIMYKNNLIFSRNYEELTKSPIFHVSYPIQFR